jgi:spatacsin
MCANMLRLDIAALQRISSYYSLAQQNKKYELSSQSSPGLHVLSHGADIAPALARALADDYVQSDHLHVLEQKQNSGAPKREQPSQPLIAILEHLERASLPLLDEGRTCGFWLFSGIGDASVYRSQQNEASQHWNLVTEFCQTHHLPLSTKYLALLANDNDWVLTLFSLSCTFICPSTDVSMLLAGWFSNRSPEGWFSNRSCYRSGTFSYCR